MRILIFILILVFISCEKDINIKLDPSQSRLVVDASIENNQPPLVFLSKSLDFFGKINPEVLSSSLVRNAKIKISDGTTEVLKILLFVEIPKFIFIPHLARTDFSEEELVHVTI
jgi:hypothetical protein